MPSLVLAMPRWMAGDDIFRFCHPLAIAAEGARHGGVVTGISVERYFSVEIGITFNSIAMLKLYEEYDMIGSRSRTAVSKSIPVKAYRGVAQTFMQRLGGFWPAWRRGASPSP